MTNKVRDTLGKFTPKSEAPRKIRSVNLTDDAWHWLATVAEKAGVSRNDYLEGLASSKQPFMEMVERPPTPFIETVQTEIEADDANITRQPDSKLLPLIETVRAENQRLHIELGNSESEKESFKQELLEVRSQLETEHADREEIEAELGEKKQNSAPTATLSEKLTPDAATILSQLRARRKKSSVSLADIEAILEIMEKS